MARHQPRSPSDQPLGVPVRARCGAVAVLAMLFLVLLGTLSLAMYTLATVNVQSAMNLSDVSKARSAAESGLRWMSWRFTRMARPRTAIGSITAAVAESLWPSIRSSIQSDLASMLTAAERPVTFDATTLTTASIAVESDGGRFIASLRPHPLYAGDPLNARYLRLSSTGSFRGAMRSVAMDIRIDKKVKFAIVGKVPIQIGRNTLVEGPIGMATPNKYPPLLMLSDFRHLTAALTSRIDQFNTFLEDHHRGYDNRLNVHDAVEFTDALNAGFSDVNGDGFIDEYDLFVKQFDHDGDGRITSAEFINPATGQSYDADLFKAIDSLGAPESDADPARLGFQDGVIDNRDGYTKVRGQISLAATADAWARQLEQQGDTTIGDLMRGPIQPQQSSDLPVKFGATSLELFDLSPTNFDTSGFRAKTGPENGASDSSGGVTTVTVENKVLSVSDTQKVTITSKGQTNLVVGRTYLKSDFDAANAAQPANKRAAGTDASQANAQERTPYGSTSYQATYDRPVFKNMVFKNVRIPKGLNALFDNCTFEGVTYVEMETNITKSNGQTTTSASDAMAWSKKMKVGNFSSSTALTSATSYGFEQGNNLRFNNCLIRGPLASDVPTAYSHFTNSWEFTGATLFDNQEDATATIVAPQTNIEMGSFTDPSKAPSTLIGVVVAGNLDIRGTSSVDGSIIITGDGAGNTTQGWFGPSDSSTDSSSPMPEGGWGRLNIRYNPTRALPDGINVAIDLLPDPSSYCEGIAP